MIRKLLKKFCERMRIQKESVLANTVDLDDPNTQAPPKDYVDGEFEVVEPLVASIDLDK
jgi:hypothetical protein